VLLLISLFSDVYSTGVPVGNADRPRAGLPVSWFFHPIGLVWDPVRRKI